MAQRNAPGSCADCGNDAYIRLAGENGDSRMVCAHCFADRVRSGAVKSDEKSAPRRRVERVESDTRIHR
ncbi:MAG: hypothetical protein A3G84_05290 [Chloroflexi bacterium RIFCSPLOWO2_12_FULL_71_12]|nr:MAG: hypothetical protein A2082_04460 [Chloroflexi bacterium GWC2_70_10]OGO70771.1 MAG: hypothetical protein A3H36_04530 [Chloroflexi bacterium RIFCSPLOWO2_02_FULL_71_16]OGO74354.1 MAG: hypothetical protein A3G84_05290 [Chloroflexi bacterium RIFCSPLOWO2_12_FULL_71_12]